MRLVATFTRDPLEAALGVLIAKRWFVGAAFQGDKGQHAVVVGIWREKNR